MYQVRNNRWVSPRHYTVNPMLLPSGNPIKCHERVLSSPRLFSWQPRNLLTLGREFESRCRQTNWDFSSQKKKKKDEKMLKVAVNTV